MTPVITMHPVLFLCVQSLPFSLASQITQYHLSTLQFCDQLCHSWCSCLHYLPSLTSLRPYAQTASTWNTSAICSLPGVLCMPRSRSGMFPYQQYFVSCKKTFELMQFVFCHMPFVMIFLCLILPKHSLVFHLNSSMSQVLFIRSDFKNKSVRGISLFFKDTPCILLDF